MTNINGHSRLQLPPGIPREIRFSVQMMPAPNATAIHVTLNTPQGLQAIIIGGMTSLETVAAEILAAIAAAPPVVFQSEVGPVVQAHDPAAAVKQAVDLAQALLDECRRRERAEAAGQAGPQPPAAETEVE